MGPVVLVAMVVVVVIAVVFVVVVVFVVGVVVVDVVVVADQEAKTKGTQLRPSRAAADRREALLRVGLPAKPFAFSFAIPLRTQSRNSRGYV